MKIRLMKQSDFLDIYTLLKKVGLSIGPKEREVYEFTLIHKLNPQSCFIAKEKNKTIGAIFGAFNGKRGWIYHLVVHPNYQKKGIGSLLLKKAEESIQIMGATKIFLGVAFTNLKVVPFYEKNGWIIEQDAILMKKDLWKLKIKKGV